MKIIETGTTYKVYGEDLVVLDNLPAQTYKVGCGQFTGFFLEKQHDLEIKEDKIYGVHEEKANKVLNRFEKSRKNLGVILSGDKGIGKSLFARLLAQKAIQNGIPVILVDDVAGNSVRLKFKGNNVVFDNKTNIFSVSNDKINVTYDDDYLDDDVKDMYKKLHYTYAEIALNYGNRIHYNLV